jgi:Lrp/AsnC family transcriptional regulator, leucine-responsive regulatory protein
MTMDHKLLDPKDMKILSALMKDPRTSQSTLATKLKLSQPSINARIQKLRAKGLVAESIGIDFNKSSMQLVRIDCTVTNAPKLLDTLKDCSFFVNGFTMSGQRNVSMLIIVPDLQKAETIIDTHLRTNSQVSDIQTSVTIRSTKPFICSVNLEGAKSESCNNSESCEHCPLHGIHK